MKTQRVLTCPHCKKRGFIGPHYEFQSGYCLVCCACGWKGTYETVETFEYRRERVVHFKIDYHVIDEIVHQYYGVGGSENKYYPAYEFVAIQECSNDSCHEFDVDGVLDTCTKESAVEFRENGNPGNLSNYDILNILCKDGWLEPGTYLVKVCW